MAYVVLAMVLAWFFEQRLPTTVILVRHAETDAAMMAAGASGDPPLNARGRLRAEALANFLEDVDVVRGLDAIYATEALRTQQTAAPIAQRLGLEVQIADQHAVEEFARHVRREHREEIVLVVSHSDVIGEIIDELHGHQNVPPIEPDEFDNVYIVTVPWLFGKVKTLRLHYGQELGVDGKAASFNEP
ncbi:MAG TPA: phosphoglycerate mutase family protein [Gammaproteobacteria bacterium]